jgi:hypothetical protein
VGAFYTPATFDSEWLFGARLGKARCQSLPDLAHLSPGVRGRPGTILDSKNAHIYPSV